MADYGKKTIRSWRRLEKAHALVYSRIEQDLKAAGLPPLSWLRAMDEIARESDGLRPFQLQQALQIEQPAVSRLLEKLAGAGHVSRTEIIEDRRGWRVRLTETGAATQAKMATLYAAALSQHYLPHLSDKQARALDEVLGDFLDSARAPASGLSSAPASP